MPKQVSHRGRKGSSTIASGAAIATLNWISKDPTRGNDITEKYWKLCSLQDFERLSAVLSASYATIGKEDNKK